MFGPQHGSPRNHSVYHDSYRRTPDGWRFEERRYEIRYLDTTPLTGSTPEPATPELSTGRTA
jgi:hypothetical protein